jgi:hypothetical protein
MLLMRSASSASPLPDEPGTTHIGPPKTGTTALQAGRDRVILDDAHSPIGAYSLRVCLGWRTRYVTESWHGNVSVIPLLPETEPVGSGTNRA